MQGKAGNRQDSTRNEYYTNGGTVESQTRHMKVEPEVQDQYGMGYSKAGNKNKNINSRRFT